MKNLSQHPCFNNESHHRFGRIHLPVAPKCNVQCNFFNRKYSCFNENRPGVTSTVLTPNQALAYFRTVYQQKPNLSVVGIAGPGDPMANPDETLTTLQLIRAEFPNIMLCLASNGLNLHDYLDDFKRLDVSHVTLTINAIDPVIASKIYAWVRHNKVIYRGQAAGQYLLERQMQAIYGLKERGITVKVNTIILPGINDHHIVQVAEKIAAMKVDVMNCIPVVPTPDTLFSNLPVPTGEMTTLVRQQASDYLPQMDHCTRCRADAIGLLGEQMNEDNLHLLQRCSQMAFHSQNNRRYVAVASMEGIFVNMHLGEARALLIYKYEDHGLEFVEERVTPEKGTGITRWKELAHLLQDCQALVVSGSGDTPRGILSEASIRVIEAEGLIDQIVVAVYENRSIRESSKMSSPCTRANVVAAGKDVDKPKHHLSSRGLLVRNY